MQHRRPSARPAIDAMQRSCVVLGLVVLVHAVCATAAFVFSVLLENLAAHPRSKGRSTRNSRMLATKNR